MVRSEIFLTIDTVAHAPDWSGELSDLYWSFLCAQASWQSLLLCSQMHFPKCETCFINSFLQLINQTNMYCEIILFKLEKIRTKIQYTVIFSIKEIIIYLGSTCVCANLDQIRLKKLWIDSKLSFVCAIIFTLDSHKDLRTYSSIGDNNRDLYLSHLLEY